jgi:PAS domain S-box-containing protein
MPREDAQAGSGSARLRRQSAADWASDKRFARATIDALSISVCVVDESGRIVAANKAWRDFAAANGADPDRVSEGTDYFEVCQIAAAQSNSQAAEFLARTRSILAGECRRFSIEYDCHSPTEQRWCVATVTRFPGDGPVRLVITHEDVSESKRVEQALRQSQERLNSILGSLHDVIWSVAPDTYQPLYLNGAAAQLYGHPVRAFFDDHGLWRRLLHPEDRERVLGSLTELLATGRCELEYRIVRSDGSVRWVRDRARVIRGEDGEMLRLDGIVTDITDLKQAQDALRENTSRLQRLSAHLESVREEQSANIAREVHDELGGTLTMLKLGLASVLYKTKQMEPVRHQLEAMLAQVDTGIQAVKRISTTLRPGMLDTLGLMATIKWYVGEFSRLSGILTALELPEYIRLSPERSTAVFRIIQEALTNVARHAGASEVRVSVRKHRGQLILELRDNGRGIADAQANRPGSFGVLGMRERAQYLGGELSIKGTPGQGTTLILSLPLREPVHGENPHR